MLARRPASEPPPTAPSNLGQTSKHDRHEGGAKSGLFALEAALKDASVGALLVITAPPAALEAIGGHVERRLELDGATVVRASSGPGGDGFRLALARLRGPMLRAVQPGQEVAAEAPSARDAAVEILTQLSASGGARRVVVVDPTASRFSRAVAAELEAAGEAAGGPVVWVTAEAPPGSARVLELNGQLDAREVEGWWSAASASVVPQLRSFEALDAWWRGARLDQAVRHAPEGASSELAQALRLVGRAWPEKRIAELLPEHARGTAATLVAELSAVGAVEVGDGGVLAIGALPSEGTPDPAIGRRAAAALGRVFGDDPWATFRAAEICFSVGDIAEGDAHAQRAITNVVDGDARADFWARLGACQPVGAGCGAKRLLAYVTLGLFTGDVDIALRFAREAAAIEPDSAEVLLALGKCHAAMGDAPAALVTMQRAGDRTKDAILRARIEVELAEVKYRTGDLVAAKAGAEAALGLLPPSGGEDVRLDARNVVGKLLLARASFADAELHFTADACEAALARQPMAEMRARVNRAISVLYTGRRGEAQALLEAVLEDAAGESVPRGFALVNLAVIATLDHRYADALEITERAAKAVFRTGDRLSFARCTANLTDLRLRVGLVDEADQALRFGARFLKGSLPGMHIGHFSILQARVHLARGDSGQAHHAILRALSELGASVGNRPTGARPGGVDAAGRGPGRELVSQALRIAAHVALEDGDTTRARVLIEQAEVEGGPTRAQAELALLRAMLARAVGEPFAQPARSALEAAREVDDIELMRDAHMVLFQAARSDRDTATARHHLAAALSYRDRMAIGLPEAMRLTFYARREILALEREAQAFEATVTLVGPSPEAQREVGDGAPPARAQVRVGAVCISERPRIVGEDPAIRSLLNAVRKVGPSDATVLIHGESGTGKELVAEALHTSSGRRTGPLVKVNCAALVETLLLSELFGHEKGSFTGAAARRRGRFEAAEGGTLFLDEIGDISPRTQVALLRVLQEKTFERVGGTTPIRANVRVVCATHRNLKALVARGEFREDLYYRLCGVVLEVPALRSRLGDLGAIATAILDRIAIERGGPVKKLSSRCLTALKSYPWPGNVRELENALRAASLFAETDVLEPEDFADNVDALRSLAIVPAETLPSPGAVAAQPPVQAAWEDDEGTTLAADGGVAGRPSIPAPTPSDAAYAQVRSGTSLHDMKRIIERECIARALGEAGGNITRAAALLGMKRPRLSQLVKQYGLGSGATEGDTDEGDDLSEDEA